MGRFIWQTWSLMHLSNVTGYYFLCHHHVSCFFCCQICKRVIELEVAESWFSFSLSGGKKGSASVFVWKLQNMKIILSNPCETGISNLIQQNQCLCQVHPQMKKITSLNGFYLSLDTGFPDARWGIPVQQNSWSNSNRSAAMPEKARRNEMSLFNT